MLRHFTLLPRVLQPPQRPQRYFPWLWKDSTPPTVSDTDIPLTSNLRLSLPRKHTIDRNARLSAASVTRNLSLLIANPDSPFFVKQIKKTHRYLWQDGTVSRIENKIWWEFALVDIERAFARSYVYSLMGNKLISSVSEFGWIKFYLLFEGILLWVYLRCVNMNKQLFSFTEGSILPENLRMFIHVSFLFNSWLMCS